MGLFCGKDPPACPKPGDPTCNAGAGNGGAVLACSNAALASNRFCAHCAESGGSPLLCVASGQPCTNDNGQAVQLCSALAPEGTLPERDSGGCYTTAGGLPLAYYAEPYWIAKNAKCMGNKGRGNVGMGASMHGCGKVLWALQHLSAHWCLHAFLPAVSCECTDQAPGIKVLHRVAQPFFYQPCWVGGMNEAGVLGRCEPTYFTGRRRVSGCGAETIYPWCYAEFTQNGRNFW